MSAEPRTIHVDYMARVEGEGSLTIRIEDGQAKEVKLSIFEPPRFFEAFLRGRDHREAPDITSRICGICPVAYLMSACHAVEDALGLRAVGALRDLRRLLYCGEWIESHALHVFLLHAPDFLGFPDALAMAKVHRGRVEQGLQIKKAGNTLMALLGGREIHPINVRVGGFYRAPAREELTALLPELRAARAAAESCLVWLGGLSFPAFERDYELVALRHPNEYAMCEGRIVSSKGLDIDVHDHEDHFVEAQVPWSNALHATLRGRGAYLCGPLARFNLNYDRLTPAVQAAAAAVGLSVPCGNPFKSILVRVVEILYAFDEAIRIIEGYTPPPAAFVEAPPRAALNAGRDSAFAGPSIGRAATEAPRGLLYHRYTLDPEGTLLDARIVPPTSQNQPSIEADLAAMAAELATLPHAEATRRAEQAVRNHDPCISCATHFLQLEIARA